LVIEIADSSLRYDSGSKLARYAAAGIPEVWIARLRAREVTTHTDPAGSEYASVRVYRSGESIAPRAFPDVSLAVDDFMPPAPGPDVEIA
jgi:Uma2 family endonuclease